eukprot:5140817-Pyramimonas_sp.AAC.1
MAEGSLIRLKANVYVVDGAPVARGKAIAPIIDEHGLTRSLLEPRWWIRYGWKGEVLNVALLEVDGFFVGSSSSETRAWLRRAL